MSRKLIIEHDGKNYEGQLATITGTSLCTEDHGIFTAMLSCEWGSSGVSAGGYCLDEPEDRDDSSNFRRRGTAYGLDHILRILETVGVRGWEGLKGKHVVLLFDQGGLGWGGGPPVGLAHAIDDNKVFIFADHAEQWRDGTLD